MTRHPRFLAALLVVACRPDGGTGDASSSLGQLPARQFTITYTVPGQAPYAVTLDSRVAEQAPLVATSPDGAGRGYVVEVDDAGCPNAAVFVGTPQDLHTNDGTNGFLAGVLPLSPEPFQMRADVSMKVFDVLGDLHYFPGGTYVTSSLAANAWTVEVRDSEHCFHDGNDYVCALEPLALRMTIEGDILVDPDPAHLEVSDSAYMTEVSTGDPACSARVLR